MRNKTLLLFPSLISLVSCGAGINSSSLLSSSSDTSLSESIVGRYFHTSYFSSWEEMNTYLSDIENETKETFSPYISDPVRDEIPSFKAPQFGVTTDGEYTKTKEYSLGEYPLDPIEGISSISISYQHIEDDFEINVIIREESSFSKMSPLYFTYSDEREDLESLVAPLEEKWRTKLGEDYSFSWTALVPAYHL